MSPKRKTKSKSRQAAPPPPPPPENLSELWAFFGRNRAGLIGFGLSLLQLCIHASWIGFATWLDSTGQSQQLDGNSWQMWVVASLLILGTLVTAVSLFLCLYGTLRGYPKLLAGMGLCISFFVGTVTMFVLVLNMSSGGA